MQLLQTGLPHSMQVKRESSCEHCFAKAHSKLDWLPIDLQQFIIKATAP
jgi:hypothetical protein